MKIRSKHIAVFFGVAASLGAYSGAVLAQTSLPTPSQSSESFKDWSVECTSIPAQTPEATEGVSADSQPKVTRVCEAVQIYKNSKTGNEFARLAFAYGQNEDAKKLLSGMRLLVDVSFETSPEIVIKEEVLMTGKIARCIDRFCYAEFPIDADSVAKLKEAKEAVVRYPIGNGKKISIAISSNGLTEALNTIENR